MAEPTALALNVPLPHMRDDGAARVQLGRIELVLERARGGHSLLWSDGRESRRYVLGLSDRGRLCIELRAPRMPVHVVPREVLTIVPGARLCGYVTVPLVPTLVWRDLGNAPTVLLELHPKELRGCWDEASGHSLRCSASWLVRFPFRTGDPQVVVPLRLHNASREPVCPGHLPLQLHDRDLVAMRGSIVVRPQRITWPAVDGASPADAPCKVEQA